MYIKHAAQTCTTIIDGVENDRRISIHIKILIRQQDQHTQARESDNLCQL